ncbi:MAG TPA: ABC transporter substrate-binding protein [Xanthobacteraceae bacterium]|jgi:iron(III) transport system substrate-binding protein
MFFSFLSRIVVLAALTFAANSFASAQEMNLALKQLAAAANKEGTLTLSWSQSTLAGIQGAARFQTAMNKLYGTNIRINFLPGADMARIINQLATEYAAGQKASVDIALGAAPQLVPVLKADFFEPVDWKSYLPGRITDQMIEMGGRLIRIVTGLSGATYNSALAPMKPTTLDDFLKPAWKGKIASTPYAAGFDVLLADDVWGRERTFAYVRALSKQISGLIRCGEAERIATGEYLALVMDCTGQDALQWQEKGAPLGQMMPLDAAQQRYYYFAIPKNAQHPEAAKLYTIFTMTPEGQKLAYDTWKTDLHFLPGSKMGKMVDDYRKVGVKFKEVTVDWYRQHPEIDAGKSELIRILTTKG